MIFEWLLGRSEHAHVTPWNAVIAERYADETARMLLGACGPVRAVGNRVDEAIRADRERRAAQMSGRGNVIRIQRA